MKPAAITPLGWFAALWGTAGVLALLGQALYRLTPLALEPLRTGRITTFQLVLYATWLVFNLYAEGYRGFQKRFSPRVALRALHLARNPRPLHVVLAPAFCMSFFHATRRGLIVAWGITSMVILLVLLVRMLPQPWRGIVDGGVVAGLAWGAAAIIVSFVRILLGHELGVDPELPATAEA